MSADDVLFHAGHRERLKAKLLDGKLTSYEKLELLLGKKIAYEILLNSVKILFSNLFFISISPI